MDIEKLQQPIIELYVRLEDDILKYIAKSLSKYDCYIPAAEHKRRKLEEMGYLRQEILRKMAKVADIAEIELKTIMLNSVNDTLEVDTKYYLIHGLLEEPQENMSVAMKQILEETFKATGGEFKNLTKTTANTATKQLEDALDRAWLQVQSGAFSAESATRLAIKDVAKTGIRAVTYPTGWTDTIEVVVRRAVYTGINQANLRAREVLADDVGCDLVEVSAHSGARPEHAEWQGRIYSRSGSSKKYPEFVEATGYGSGHGLGGYNCRHTFYPYVEGAERQYSEVKLFKIEEKTVEYDGIKYTEYEASQMQRKNERNIRRWKRESLALNAAGYDRGIAELKIEYWQARQRDFLKQTKRKRQVAREQVY